MRAIPTTWAITARLRLVDTQVAALMLLSIQCLDRGFAVVSVRHLDECETTATAGFAIHDNLCRYHFTELGKQIDQFFIRGTE